MRTLIALACLATIGGCVIVTPSDGDFRIHTAFSSSTVQGNGVPARDERAVARLQKLEVHGAMVVEVRAGQAPSLVVEADSNLLPIIRTEAKGDTLEIRTEGSYRSTMPIRITYTVPVLTEVGAHGSGRVLVSGLNGASLDLHKYGSGVVELTGAVESLDVKSHGSGSVAASALRTGKANLVQNGSGHIVVGDIRGESANIGLTGSGQIHASGAVRSLNVKVTGSGNVNVTRLESERADLISTGSGGISAHVRKNLVAQNSGSGGIRVDGNPEQRTVSGKRVYVN